MTLFFRAKPKRFIFFFFFYFCEIAENARDDWAFIKSSWRLCVQMVGRGDGVWRRRVRRREWTTESGEKKKKKGRGDVRAPLAPRDVAPPIAVVVVRASRCGLGPRRGRCPKELLVWQQQPGSSIRPHQESDKQAGHIRSNPNASAEGCAHA